MRRPRHLIGFASLLFLAAVHPRLLHGQEVTKAKWLWQVDLKKYGAHGPRLGIVNDPSTSIEVACSDHVVAVVFIPKLGVLTDSSPVVALFFDSQSGKLLAQKNFNVSGFPMYRLYATASGNFLLYFDGADSHAAATKSSDSFLILLSPQGEMAKGVRVPVDHVEGSFSWIYVSSAGDRMLLSRHSGETDHHTVFGCGHLTEEKEKAGSENAKYSVVAVSAHNLMRLAKGTREIHLRGRGEYRTECLFGRGSSLVEFLGDDWGRSPKRGSSGSGNA